MRPIIQRAWQSAKIATIGGTIGLSSFFIYTRNTTFTAIDASEDSIFQTVSQKGWNPHNNPTTHDFYVRRVSLNDIRPELRESPVKLTEAFCAGVWSNWGFSIQRVLSKRAQNDSNQDHLWTIDELRSSDYKENTIIADSFEVLEKKEDRILIRGGDSPSNQELRPFDVVLELSAVKRVHENAVDFGFKSVFFVGDKEMKEPPMPGFVVWLHLQYAKLLLETGVSNVTIG